MQLVTGGAGFIGSHIVRALNARGIGDILVVDNLQEGNKFVNLRDCQIADYMDKVEFHRALVEGRFSLPLTRIYHQGACSDTLERNGRYLLENNFTFSKHLLGHALEHKIPFVYASSAAIYGNSRHFAEQPENELPLNPYGYSKLVFDQHVRNLLPRAESTVAGLRYFNVYGPRESLKGHMASMVYHIHQQTRAGGRAKLFEGTDGFLDGEQRRDFVYVEDVVKVNLFFGEGPTRSGIFNVGSGASTSFNELAEGVISLQGCGSIDYIPFVESLRGKYQAFTEADLSALRAAGYSEPFTPLIDGIAASITAWNSASPQLQPG